MTISHVRQRRWLRASLVCGTVLFGANAAGLAAPVQAATASPKVVLGGGQLTREYAPNAAFPGDHYVVAVVTPSKRTVSLFFNTNLRCTGDPKAIATTYSKTDLPIPKSGAVAAVLPSLTDGGPWAGELSVRVEFGTRGFNRAKVTVLSGVLNRIEPKAECSADPASFNLRIARPGAKAGTKPGAATKGGAYLGAAADQSQLTAVLFSVSADGQVVTNRAVDLFLECSATTATPRLEVTDYGASTIASDGSFRVRQEWQRNGSFFGIDSKYRVELKTHIDGRFNGTRVAGIARFDADIIDVAAEKVVDTCTSGDQSFEATV